MFKEKGYRVRPVPSGKLAHKALEHESLDKIEAFKSGGVDYVTKPFQFEEVEARVETHLRKSSARHR